MGQHQNGQITLYRCRFTQFMLSHLATLTNHALSKANPYTMEDVKSEEPHKIIQVSDSDWELNNYSQEAK